MSTYQQQSTSLLAEERIKIIETDHVWYVVENTRHRRYYLYKMISPITMVEMAMGLTLEPRPLNEWIKVVEKRIDKRLGKIEEQIDDLQNERNFLKTLLLSDM